LKGDAVKKNALLSASLLLAFASLAVADPVDNPGDFTLDFDTGRIKIGNLPEGDFVGVSVAGTVLDTAGNISASVAIPDITVGSPLGDFTLHFVALADAVGSLDAVAGGATLSVPLQMFLMNPNLPPECRIDRMDIALTTDAEGTLTGIPYDMTDGTATYVNNSFSVPVTTGCGLVFGALIDSYVGLPAEPGVNYIDNLHGTFSTVFTGS
jgi:hypothetical protein